MSFFNKIRVPYADDKVAQLLFLVTLFTPLYIILPLPDPIELPKLTLWVITVGIILLILAYKKSTISTNLSKISLICIGLFFMWTVLSTVFSEDIINSLFGSTIRLTNSVLFIFLWSLWVFLISSVTTDKFKWLIHTVIVSGGLIAVWGVLQSFEIGFYSGLSPGVRSTAPSFLGNPNFTAMFLVPVFFLGLWSVVDTTSTRLKIFYASISALVAWGVIQFTSRGAILGFLAGLFVVWVLLLVIKRWKLFLTISGVIILVIVISTLFTKSVRPVDSQQLTTLSDQTTVERLLLWDFTVEYIKSNPWFGSGPSNFFLAYRQFDHPAMPLFGWFDDAHNLPLHIAATIGIPALLLLSILVANAVLMGLRSIWDNPQNSLFTIFCLAGLVGWLVASSFNPVTTANWLIFGLLIVGLYQGRSQVVRLPWKRWNGLIFVSIGTVLILVGVIMQLSDVLVWRSNVNYGEGDYQRGLVMARWAKLVNPANINSYENLLKNSSALGDYKTLEQTALAYEHLHPKSAGTLQKAMSAYYLMFRADGNTVSLSAFYELAKAYKSSFPNNVTTNQNLFYAYTGIGDYSKALRVAQENVVLDNKNAFSWFLLAKAYEKVGNPTGLVFALEKSFQLHATKSMALLLSEARNSASNGEVVPVPVVIPDRPW